ncbi:MAG: hypothetical protein H8E45_07470 [Proteobacteria bacterium]|nr:hypothetical protein [Pseudomonadota bacterium]
MTPAQNFVAVFAVAVFLVPTTLPAHVTQPSKDAQKCRKTINKNVGKYMNTALKELGSCYKSAMGKGTPALASDCGSVATGDLKGKIAGAESKALAGISGKCVSTLGETGALSSCPWPCDSVGAIAGFSDLASCQVCLARTEAEAMTVATFGSADVSLSKDQQGCLNTMSKGGGKMAKTVLKTIAKCYESVDKGKSSADCSDLAQADAKGKITKAAGKLADGVAKKCSDATLASLDACAGAASSVALAQACMGALYQDGSVSSAHSITGSCGTDGTCDNADEGATTCPVDCSQVSEEVQDIFTDSCATLGCHSAATSLPGAGLVLSAGVSGAQTINVASTEQIATDRVEPGDLVNSWLYTKITQNPPPLGLAMPPLAALSAPDITTIADWINAVTDCGDGTCDAAGGENLTNCSMDCGPRLPDAVQAIMDTNCATSGCHDSFTAFQGLDLSAGGAGSALVGVASTQVASTLVIPGDSVSSYFYEKVALATPGFGLQMPFGLPALSFADKQAIQDWIDNGALTQW